MGNVSPHFSRSEFACHCGCGFTAVDVELLGVLEDVRNHFNAPVTLDCACRCPPHNKAVGGAAKSQHMQGIAADIKVTGQTPDTVADYWNTNTRTAMASGVTVRSRILTCEPARRAGTASIGSPLFW